MVLLTSSQVSIAISSFIIFIFTSALFLSGYVLQQATVRDIRIAISSQIERQQPMPHDPLIHLPDGIRGDTNVREKDATLIEVAENNPERLTDVKSGGERVEEDAIAQVEAEGQDRGELQKPMKIGKDVIGENLLDVEALGDDVEGEKQLSRAARRKKIKEEILLAGEGEGFNGYRRRMW